MSCSPNRWCAAPEKIRGAEITDQNFGEQRLHRADGREVEFACGHVEAADTEDAELLELVEQINRRLEEKARRTLEKARGDLPGQTP